MQYQVSAISLRNAFAIHALADGWTVRRAQQALGHRSLRPVMRYQSRYIGISASLQRCTPPAAISPADTLFPPPELPVPALDALRLPFSPDQGTESPLRLFLRALGTGIRTLFAFRPPG